MKDVERLLGYAVDVVETLDYGEGATHDVLLVQARDDAERRLVVKRARGDTGPLMRERLALESYAEHPESAALVPAIVAASSDGALLVVEALPFTDADRLGVILEGEDRVRAEGALLAHVRALAVLNGVPAARSFARRVELAGGLAPSRHAVNAWRDHLRALPARLAAFGVDVPGVADEVDDALQRLTDAGPFEALSHGDGTAANTFVTGEGRAYVIDFETAGVRHAQMDGAFGKMRYLNSVWALNLPFRHRNASAEAFRETLAEFVPAAQDIDRWGADATAAAAAWLSILLRRPERYMVENRRWGRSGMRFRVTEGLDQFEEVADEHARMVATSEACGHVGQVILDIWTEEDCTSREYRALASDQSA